MHIVIVGGGIAGLATAAFLRERTDFDIEVFERSGPISLEERDNGVSSRKGDYGIAIAPNGVACLDQLGMKDPVSALNGSELGQILLRDAHNPQDVQGQVYEFRKLFGFPSIFCRRSALITWLTRKCVEKTTNKKPVKIRNDCKTIRIDAMQGKIELVDLKHSPNKIESIQADLLICADGIAKVGRQAVLRAQQNVHESDDHSPAIEPTQSEKILQFSFMSVISPDALKEREKLRFLVENDKSMGGRSTLANFYHDAPYQGMRPEEILEKLQKHKRILLYPIDHNGYHQLFAYGAMTDEILARFGRGPLVAKKTGYNSDQTASDQIQFTDSSSTDSTPLPSPVRATSRGVNLTMTHKIPRGSILHHTSTKEAFEMFKMFAPELNSLLLLNGEEEGIDLCLVRDSDPINKWSVNGKTVLVGDAAHASVPHTGQGSSQAMEDAETLSFVLSKLEGGEIKDLNQALQTFEQIRIPIAHKAQITARMANGHLPGLEKMDLEKYNREILLWTSTEKQLEEMKGQENKLANGSSSDHSTTNVDETKRSTAVSVQ